MMSAVQRRGTRVLDQPDAAADVQDVAETGIEIDDQRQVADLGDVADGGGEFAQGHQTQIRKAAPARDATAGAVGCGKTGFGHETGRQTVPHAWGDDNRLRREKGTQPRAR
jgi:hypothetical protein